MRIRPHRTEQGIHSSHTLVPLGGAKRNIAGPALLLGFALVIGVAGAMVWLTRTDFRQSELPPAATQIAERVTVIPTALDDAREPGDGLIPEEAFEADDPGITSANTPVLPTVVEADVVPAASAASMPSALAKSQGARPQLAVVAALSPTSTATRVPYVDSIEGVVGRGGTALWSETDGRLIRYLDQGVLLAVIERSTDGEWLGIRTVDDAENEGWVDSGDVLVFDVERLRPRDLVLMPITPTPTAQPTSTVAAGAEDSPNLAEATPTVGSAKGGGGDGENFDRAERSAPVGDGPTARVELDGSRLNIRSGPGSTYPVITKALPGEVFLVLARNEDSDWLQLAVADIPGGFGWVAAEYVALSVPVAELPVEDTISDAPPYHEGDDATGRMNSGIGNLVSVSHEPPLLQPADSSQTKTGLFGKLVLQQTWGGSIYLYDLATGELRLLTGGFDPSLSPDGTQVAFTRGGGENGLYLINVDGSNEHLIFGGRELLRSPKWSPDGKSIVFRRGDQFIICRDGQNRCPDDDGDPELGYPDGIERQPQLARVSVDGGDYRDLPVLLHAEAPDWNEAGIVYESQAGIQVTKDLPDFRTELVYFNIKKQYELDPDWQPGGGIILFQRREASHWEIFRIMPDGSGLAGLTKPPFALAKEFPSNVAPAWSPDGRHIVFLSTRAADNQVGPWRVWVMDADGANQRPLPVELDFTYTFVSEQMVDWGR